MLLFSELNTKLISSINSSYAHKCTQKALTLTYKSSEINDVHKLINFLFQIKEKVM